MMKQTNTPRDAEPGQSVPPGGVAPVDEGDVLDGGERLRRVGAAPAEPDR